jgi:hypothetical protein
MFEYGISTFERVRYIYFHGFRPNFRATTDNHTRINSIREKKDKLGPKSLILMPRLK